MDSRGWIAVGLLVAVGTMAGCRLQFYRAAEPAGLTKASSSIEAEKLTTCQQRVEQLEGQLHALQNWGPQRQDYLISVAAIELGSFTKGYDDDNDGVADGVKVYLELRDRQGDGVKGAGSCTVKLFDLQADAESNLIAQLDVPLAQFNDYWLDGFLADHYLFKMAWPTAPPTHEDVTVDVTFVDALTGKTLRVQQMVPLREKP